MNQRLATPVNAVLMNDAGPRSPQGIRTASLSLGSSAGAPIEHVQWRAAREMVVAATRSVPSLVLVLGAAGTGKSLLMRDLARVLTADGAEILMQSRGDLPVELAQPTTAPVSPDRARRIVLIDEADRMDTAALERLARLGPCAVVLAGLADPTGASGANGVSTIVKLAPLDPAVVPAFVSARLAQSGLPEDLFDETAVTRLVARSGNVPRVLDALITAAVFVARGEAVDRITERHVDLAAGFRDDEEPLPAPAKAETVARQPAEATPPPAASAAPAAADSLPVGPNLAWASANEEYHQALAAERRRQAWRGSAAFAAIAACAIGGWLWFEQTGRPDVDYSAMAAALRAAGPAATHKPAPADLVANTGPALPAAAPVTAMPAAPDMTTPADPELKSSEAAATSQAPEPSGAQQALPPADVVPAVAAARLPRNAPGRVVVRYAGDDPGAAVRAGELAQSLRAAGFMVESPAAVGRAAAGPAVRYFFGEDREAADAVIRASGLPGPAMLAKVPRGAPSAPGAIELLVPSAGVPPQGAPLPVNNAARREEAPASMPSKQHLQRG